MLEAFEKAGLKVGEAIDLVEQTGNVQLLAFLDDALGALNAVVAELGGNPTHFSVFEELIQGSRSAEQLARTLS